MRILHISKIKGIAGSEKHLLMLLPGLARKGVDVSMLTLEDPHVRPESFYQELEASGIPNTRMPIRHHMDPGLLNRMTKYIRAYRPDLVHTHLLHADLYGLYAARRAGIRHAVSSRHNDNPFRCNFFIHWMNRRAMRHARKVITISHALARFVRDVERVDEEQIVTVHYGLDFTAPDPGHRDAVRRKLGYKNDEMVAGFFGRLIPQKGVDILLDAFKRVRDRHPAARLLIVGDGSLRTQLERLAAKLGLEKNVRFTGWVEKAHHLMPACDLVAMPSRWEGFGLVALEAMNAERPLVVTPGQRPA